MIFVVEAEGIFRQSGGHAVMQKIKESYDAGYPIQLSKYDVHEVTGILKQFFRELPEPLIPGDINQKIAEVLCKFKKNS
jgi:hypothetical protein